MKEYIEREAAIEKLNDHLHAMIDDAPISQGTKDIYEMAYRHVEDVLRKFIPAADVVEVVRCTKCKHWLPGTILANDTFEPPYCLVHKAPMHGDDYCSYGERKMDGGEHE